MHGVDYDHYLNLGKFVDLFRVVKQAIRVSQNSYSIKEIEKYYDFKRMEILKKVMFLRSITFNGWRQKIKNF